MEKLTRTTYRDPATGDERDGSAARREILLDHEAYVRPLERAHGSALHPTGVATGLEVRATRGAADVRVLPGVALTEHGDHVILAQGGNARVEGSLRPVTGDGVAVPTAGLDGRYLLTIAWAETFDRRTFDDSAGRRIQTDHTPQLALRRAAETDLGAEVVLATVTLVTGAVAGVDGEQRRHCTDLLTVRRADQVARGPDLTVRSAVAAELTALPDIVELRLGVDGLLAAGELAVRGAYANEARANTLHVEDRLTVSDEFRVDGEAFIGTQREGRFLCLNDNLWFSDPQDGTMHIRSGDDSTWGHLVGTFTQASSAAFKEDVEVLGEDRLRALHDDVVATPVAEFRYRGDGNRSRRSLGLILEHCPSYLADGIGVNPVEYAAMLHAAVTVLSRRLNSLTAQVEALSAGSTGNGAAR